MQQKLKNPPVQFSTWNHAALISQQIISISFDQLKQIKFIQKTINRI